MHRSENFRRLAKVFIVAFLCSEMHSSLTQSNDTKDQLVTYPSSVNGTETLPEHAKHQASVRLRAKDSVFGEGHICGGAVVAPSVVLTVAHCVFNYQKNAARHPSELKVVMGTRSRYQRAEHTLIYGVTHIYQPKTFDARTLRDNIAIIMLDRDIPKEHPTVQPVTLADAAFRNTAAAAAAASEVTSWCVTPKLVPYTQLMTLNVTLLADEKCTQHFGQFYGAGRLCVSYAPHIALPACVGDAGAPLLHRQRLLGLSSYGSGCAEKTQPTIYTDVAYHGEWIAKRIGDGRNRNSSLWGGLGLLLFTLWTVRSTKWMAF